jgi:Ca2+-binding EF-hand superfamily protein
VSDTDGDGKLSRKEAVAGNPRVAEIFDDIDTDSDGFISPEEDKAALFRWYKERESASAED